MDSHRLKTAKIRLVICLVHYTSARPDECNIPRNRLLLGCDACSYEDEILEALQYAYIQKLYLCLSSTDPSLYSDDHNFAARENSVLFQGEIWSSLGLISSFVMAERLLLFIMKSYIIVQKQLIII